MLPIAATTTADGMRWITSVKKATRTVPGDAGLALPIPAAATRTEESITAAGTAGLAISAGATHGRIISVKKATRTIPPEADLTISPVSLAPATEVTYPPAEITIPVMSRITSVKTDTQTVLREAGLTIPRAAGATHGRIISVKKATRTIPPEADLTISPVSLAPATEVTYPPAEITIPVMSRITSVKTDTQTVLREAGLTIPRAAGATHGRIISVKKATRTVPRDSGLALPAAATTTEESIKQVTLAVPHESDLTITPVSLALPAGAAATHSAKKRDIQGIAKAIDAVMILKVKVISLETMAYRCAIHP